MVYQCNNEKFLVIFHFPHVSVPHFRHLISVLTPIYWTVAKELDGAYNGFSLTEGDFTREVQVEYTTGKFSCFLYIARHGFPR